MYLSKRMEGAVYDVYFKKDMTAMNADTYEGYSFEEEDKTDMKYKDFMEKMSK